MSFLNFVRAPVEKAISTVMSQQKAMEELNTRTLGYVPRVEGAWRGGDEKEFEADMQRKLIPAIQKLMQAIGGFGGNLGGAMSVMDTADTKITGMVGGLADEFSKILK